MPRLLMLIMLACLTLSPAIRSADAEAPGVVFHLDSDTSMNRMLASGRTSPCFQSGYRDACHPDWQWRQTRSGGRQGCQWRAVQRANGAVDGIGHPHFCLRGDT